MPGTFELYFAIGLAALGSGVVIWGANILARLPRSQAAIERWLQSLKYVGGANFALAQFDLTTLGLLARYQRRIQGALVVGGGAGLLMGDVLSVGFWRFVLNANAQWIDQSTWIYFIYGPLAFGMILGIGVSAIASGAAVGSSRLATPPLEDRPARRGAGVYRERWFFGLICLVFALNGTFMALVITNTLPASSFTNPRTGAHPPIWVLLLTPGFICFILLLAELFTWLVSRRQLSADGLEPAIAAHLQTLFRFQVIGQLWGPMIYMGIGFLSIGVGYYVAAPLAIVLGSAGIIIFVAGTFHFLLHTTRGWTQLRAALKLAAATHQRAQDA